MSRKHKRARNEIPPRCCARLARFHDAVRLGWCSYAEAHYPFANYERRANLYWPDDGLRSRLEEMLRIVRDRIVVQPGTLALQLTADWQALPGASSYGHDVETAFLLLEAAAALGHTDDARTLVVARALVDQALQEGFDWELGGFYHEGGPALAEMDRRKIWWAQAEGLHSLALMHRKFGQEDDRYLRALRKLWSFVRNHQIDSEHGGWYVVVTRDGQPRPGATVGWNKGADSKVTYHTVRALLNLSSLLDESSARP